MLKEERFQESEQLALAALIISSHTEVDGLSQAVTKAKAVYRLMESEHWFLTGREEYIFSALLAVSATDPQACAQRVERLYQMLLPDFTPASAAHTLAQVLALGDDPGQTALRAAALCDSLKAKKLNLHPTWTIASLGALALIHENEQALADDVNEAKEYLQRQKGFGSIMADPRELLIYAASVAAHCNGGESATRTATEIDGKVAGAARTRIIPAYGHIDDETPELAVSVLPEHRNRGIGSAMLTTKGFPAQKENPRCGCMGELAIEQSPTTAMTSSWCAIRERSSADEAWPEQLWVLT